MFLTTKDAFEVSVVKLFWMTSRDQAAGGHNISSALFFQHWQWHVECIKAAKFKILLDLCWQKEKSEAQSYGGVSSCSELDELHKKLKVVVTCAFSAQQP